MTDLLYGIHSVQEGLANPRRRPVELYALNGEPSGRVAQVVASAHQAGVPVRYRERRDLDRLAGSPHHQGVVLRVEPFPYVQLEDLLEAWRRSGKKGFFLALDGITDPHNFGAILRSAAAVGCHGVIIPADRSCPVTGAVDRASSGALSRIALCRVVNLARTLDELKKEGLWIFGLAAESEAGPVFRTDLDSDLVLVVGGEGSGLRPNVRKHCDLLLSIPMPGGIESLNASVAAAVVLFEALRQRSGSD